MKIIEDYKPISNFKITSRTKARLCTIFCTYNKKLNLYSVNLNKPTQLNRLIFIQELFSSLMFRHRKDKREEYFSSL